MNKISALIFVWMAFAQTVWTQQTATQSRIFTTFFPSGKANLDYNNGALDSLVEMIQEYELKDNYTVHLRAYTDDRGSEETNKKLAQERADFVDNYLASREVVIQEVQIFIAERIKDNTNAQEYRRLSRRVEAEIRYTLPEKKTDGEEGTDSIFSFKNTQAFFEHYRQQAQQKIIVDNQLGGFFIAQKGTTLLIPADAFVLPNGQPVQGNVELVVQEAYGISDMVFQGLRTVAQDSSVLQSAGMLYLEAKDSAGAKLQLDKSKSIVVSMASQNAVDSGMQVFIAPNVDAWNPWQPTYAYNISNWNKNYNWWYYHYSWRRSQYWSYKHSLWILEQGSPLITKKVPDFVAKPEGWKGTSPIRVRSEEIYKPNKEYYRQTMPQLPNETAAAHAERIQKWYDEGVKDYQRLLKINQFLTSQFLKDSMEYVQRYRQHEKQLADYFKYCKQMIEFRNHLFEELSKPNLWRVQNAAYDIFYYIQSEQYQATYIPKKIEYIRKLYALNLDKHKELEPFIMRRLDWLDKNQLSAADIKQLKRINVRYPHYFLRDYYNSNGTWNWAKYRAFIREDRRMRKQWYALYGYHYPMYKKVYDKKDHQRMTKYVGKLEHLINWQAIHRQNEEIIAGTDKEVDTLLRKNCELNIFLDYASDELTAEKYRIKNLKKAAQRRNNPNNSNTAKDDDFDGLDIVNGQRNAFRINNLGWINCDLFYDRAKELRTIEVSLKNIDKKYAPSHLQTRYLIILPKRKGLIEFTSVNDQRLIISNLPKGEKVIVLGIFVDGKKLEVFYKNDAVGNMRKIDATFEKTTLEELKHLVAGIEIADF